MISLSIFLLFVAQATVNHVNGTKRQNVLLIFVDDLRPLADKTVNLPNIRNIAANGVTFKNAFVQQALCAPSRNSMLTGRRPDALRLYDFYSYWRHTVGNFTTLPQFFKQNGYITYSVGKVFHPGQSSNNTDDFPYSWSHYPYHPSTDIYKDAAVCKTAGSVKLKRNLICPVVVKEQPKKTLPDLEILRYAVKILKKSRNITKPFLLAVGFHKPHIPFKFPQKYLNRVPIETVKPPMFPSIPANMPQVAWQPWMDVRKRDDIKALGLSFLETMPKDWTLKIRQSYYAAATYIDDLVGTLMSHVDRHNTIVVFTSDHGWSLGENGIWAKYSNFDVALKVPLIFNAPNLPRRTINSPVELVDLFPTLVELSGLSQNIPKCEYADKRRLCFDGQSLVPMMRNSKFHDEKVAMSQYPRPSFFPQINSDTPRLKDITIMGYSLSTKRYRYTEWISFNNKLFTRDWDRLYAVELYDHLIDPEESNNLHLNSEYKDLQIYLSEQLRTHVDPKQALAPANLIDRAERKPYADYGIQRMKTI